MAQIINVSLQNFESDISSPSMERPIVLTFVSARYPECSNLLTSLEKLSEELGFSLGKVDLDIPENQAFIQYFRISGVPDTRIIFKGEIADIIQGVMSEQALKERLSKHFLTESEKNRIAIEDALSNNDFETAFAFLNKALSEEPDNKKLKILQAKLLLALGDTEKAKNLLEEFKPQEEEYEIAKNLLQLLDFYAIAAKPETDEKESSLYKKAAILITENKYQEALELFLDILKMNKNWNDGAARTAMMTLFGVLGPKHALTWEYRAKLNTIWFI